MGYRIFTDCLAQFRLSRREITCSNNLHITMKKAFKYAGIVLGVILVVLGGVGLYINFSGIPTYEVKDVASSFNAIEATPARLERGKNLASMLCAGCHYDQNTGGLTGHRMTDLPAAFGKIWSRNITQDPTYGIGKWTNAQIAYFIRTGVKPSGQYVPPYMVKLPHISDEDLASILCFLRSNDTLVRPRAVQDTDCQPSFLVKALSRVAFKPYDYPTKAIIAPAVTDRVAYGKYLVNDALKCYECHSADFKTNDAMDPNKSEGYMAGDNELLDVSGQKIYSVNLTPDPKTGIGTWTEQQFIRAVKEGFAPDNAPLRYPMERMSELSDQEVGDIYAYLRTLTPVSKTHHEAEHKFTAAGTTAGQTVYNRYMCYSCHGESGAGVCDLRKAYVKYPTDDSLISWIKTPSRYVPGTKMPTWQGIIKEEEYQPLVQYVRLLGERGMKPSLSMK